MPRSGLIVANGVDAALERVLTNGTWTPVEKFGIPAEWEAGTADSHGGFEVAWQGKSVGRIRWGLMGSHNRLNALAAIAAARSAGVAPAEAIAALNSFSGIRRRMEVRGKVAGVTVYDDFAHHPTAIRTTLEGLRATVGKARVLAVLEPRSNTMKRGVMKDELPASVRLADLVYVYSAGLGWDAPTLFAGLGAKARCLEDLDALVRALVADARPGDHVLVMSNGGFGGLHAKLLAALARPAAK
jgi:UDP-N-acetylmuramate: L-alanyl-gamma-D-glutamyl-meso-diaminopimelate ligase